ncbi:unnamed protein product [Adineta steineri]|nr:unnamed protein product [Adineta steineri]CAF1358834.1 unnamed protein product [Adineta steineri]CAF1487010.1 unnamed protein product [Adineta steineri]
MSNWNNINIESTIKTDMFPNGYEASYFPAVTVQVYGNVANTGVLEFIFSPEDMQQCPLPKGYRPLLTPTLSMMKNIVVPYPYNAFLVGSNYQQYFYTHDGMESRSFWLRVLWHDISHTIKNADSVSIPHVLLISLSI